MWQISRQSKYIHSYWLICIFYTIVCILACQMWRGLRSWIFTQNLERIQDNFNHRTANIWHRTPNSLIYFIAYGSNIFLITSFKITVLTSHAFDKKTELFIGCIQLVFFIWLCRVFNLNFTGLNENIENIF